MLSLAIQLLAVSSLVTALPAPDIVIATAIEINQVAHNDIVVVDESGSVLSSAAPRTLTQVFVSLVTANTSTSALNTGLFTNSSSSTLTTSTSSLVLPSTTQAPPTTPAPVFVPSSSPAPAPTTRRRVVSSAAPVVQKNIVVESQGSTQGSGSSNYGSSSGSALDSCNSATYPDQCRSALGRHNYYRSQHSAPAMTWDDSLAQEAMAKLSLDSCGMQDYIVLDPNGHQSNAAKGGKSLSDATDQWVGEIKYFNQIGGFGSTSQQIDANVPSLGGQEVGHMVNVLFKAHTKLGCAQNLACPGPFYSSFLCFYSPYALNNNDFRTNLSPN